MSILLSMDIFHTMTYWLHDLHPRSEPGRTASKPDGQVERITSTAHLVPPIPAFPQPIIAALNVPIPITKRYQAIFTGSRSVPLKNRLQVITITNYKKAATTQSNLSWVDRKAIVIWSSFLWKHRWCFWSRQEVFAQTHSKPCRGERWMAVGLG
jgi:hypothetical protein